MAVVDTWSLRRMNIPEQFWGATYPELTAALKIPVAKYFHKLSDMLSRGVGFYVHGPTGVGKTSGSIVMLKAAWERDKLAYYTTVKDLRLAIREDHVFDGDESIISRCKEVDVLVLDDLAVDDFKNFTFGASEIEHLLSTRASRAKTTILSTRLTPDVLRTEYPGLLQAMQGSFVSIPCAGVNFKQESADRLRKELGVR